MRILAIAAKQLGLRAANSRVLAFPENEIRSGNYLCRFGLSSAAHKHDGGSAGSSQLNTDVLRRGLRSHRDAAGQPAGLPRFPAPPRQLPDAHTVNGRAVIRPNGRAVHFPIEQPVPAEPAAEYQELEPDRSRYGAGGGEL